MDNNLFEELLQSVKEAGAIMRGEMPPSRVFVYEVSSIRQVREKTGLSQADFAKKIKVSPKTLQGWETGKQKPKGTAEVLMRLLDKNPELVQSV